MSQQSSVWLDSTGAYLIRIDNIASDGTTLSPTWIDAFTGERKTPGQGIMPVSSPDSGRLSTQRKFRAIAKTGNAVYSIGDVLLRIIYFYWQSNSVRWQWFNLTTGKPLSQQSAPNSSDIIDYELGNAFGPTTASVNNSLMLAASANTDVAAIPANNSRSYLGIANNSTGVLWVAFGNPAWASGSGVGLQIPAGGFRDWPSKVPVSAVHMACTVNTPPINVIEG
jgi:hypothetical protein